MSVGSLSLAYTELSGQTYEFVLTEFTANELPRAYVPSGGFEVAVTGAAVLAGQPFRNRYIWAVSAILTKEDAEGIDNMFRKWDADRATGAVVALGVDDRTFGDQILTSALFSTPPSYERLGPTNFIVTFGLTEV